MMNYDSPEERQRAIQRKVDERHRENMAKYGWYANYVPDHSESPTGFSTHTYGFEESWGHPNMQIVHPMPPGMAHGFLSHLAQMVKEGKKFKPGMESGDLLEDMPVTFAWASESGRRVLRMIMPDRKGVVDRNKIQSPFKEQWEGIEE